MRFLICAATAAAATTLGLAAANMPADAANGARAGDGAWQVAQAPPKANAEEDKDANAKKKKKNDKNNGNNGNGGGSGPDKGASGPGNGGSDKADKAGKDRDRKHNANKPDDNGKKPDGSPGGAGYSYDRYRAGNQPDKKSDTDKKADTGKKPDKDSKSDNNKKADTGKKPDTDNKSDNGKKADTDKKPDGSSGGAGYNYDRYRTGNQPDKKDKKPFDAKDPYNGYKPPPTVGAGGFFNTGVQPGEKSPYKKPDDVRRDEEKKKHPEDKTKREARERERFEDLKRGRREHSEDGGKRIIIEEPDKRRIMRENGHITIRHDEEERFRRLNVETRRERNRDGNDVTIVLAPGGIRVYTEEDRYGRSLRRWRRYPDGREVVLYDNRSYYHRFHDRDPSFIEAIVVLPPPRLTIPRDRYIVAYDSASDDDLYETLTAPPVEDLDRTYSLEEIRQSEYLRDRMRRVDIDTITFDFGSWDVEEEDYPRLERVARVINRILRDNPDEVFLIEGHTDAVGDVEDNLTLSDRRAESVAVILSEEFGVPPENLTTQGYGEQFLKIDTPEPERLNRFVAVRRITPLLSRDFRDR